MGSPFKVEDYAEVIKTGKSTVYIKYSDKKVDYQAAIRINREIIAHNS